MLIICNRLLFIMKYSLIALAATAICGASAAAHNHRRHNHAEIFKRNACSCTTYVTSYLVPVTGEFFSFI
jgi:hypothetical protein